MEDFLNTDEAVYFYIFFFCVCSEKLGNVWFINFHVSFKPI